MYGSYRAPECRNRTDATDFFNVQKRSEALILDARFFAPSLLSVNSGFTSLLLFAPLGHLLIGCGHCTEALSVHSRSLRPDPMKPDQHVWKYQ